MIVFAESTLHGDTTLSATLAHLVLEDGTTFTGQGFGATGADIPVRNRMALPSDIEAPPTVSVGELVFNTALTGYQEVLTDPSYNGQIVCLTAPEIGVTGINPEDMESGGVQAAGLVVRHLSRCYSNWRANIDLDGWLQDAGVAGISGIDTRALTRQLRTRGAMNAAIGSAAASTPTELLTLARSAPSMSGLDLTGGVTRREPERYTEALDTVWYRHSADENKVQSAWSSRYARVEPKATEKRRVVAFDYGIKASILRHLVARGLEVEVVPAGTSAAAVLERRPHGVFLSNGPGDPAACSAIIEELRQLIGKVPVGAICLGHQLIALATGAETFKLRFGHHGANHPVRDFDTGAVLVTSQNHGFAVAENTIDRAGLVLTHASLNDGTVEGLRHKDHPLIAVQFHPEANPGPHEAHTFFDRFLTMCGE